MRITTFKNLEKKVRKASFYDSYFTLDKILYILSFFGNIASVFLASFFFSKLLSETITDIKSPYFIWGSTIFLLTALELLKRNIFTKFSKEFLRHRNIFNSESFLLTIFGILIISLSFYSSLRGAREFSSQNEIIQNNTILVVDNYKDSLKNVYDVKILKYETDNQSFQNISDRRIENQDVLNISAKTQRDKKRIEREINNIRKDKEKKDLYTNDKITELKNEYNKLSQLYETKHLSKASVDIDKNKNNSVTFVIISTIIEIIILIGVFFDNMFNFVSYNSMRDLVISKDAYKNWLLYNELLDYMYLNSVVSVDKLLELCVLNNIYISENEIKDFFKVIENVGIYEKSNLKLKKKEAEIKLNDYFKML
jgi:hypothetical protein